MENGTLVFLTVHNQNGERNPNSAIIIDALNKRGCPSIVLKSVDEAITAKIDDAFVIPLFDKEFGVNRWSSCPIKDVAELPKWVKNSSTGSCVAIGENCVQHPGIIATEARQISKLFLRDLQKNGNGNGNGIGPWESRPSSKRNRKKWRYPIKMCLGK